MTASGELGAGLAEAAIEPRSNAPAPNSNLPSWEECQLRCENSDYIAKRVAEGGYGAEPDSLLATELHRFIYEYDDALPSKSRWFRHRLERLLLALRAAGAEGVEGWREVTTAMLTKALGIPTGFAAKIVEVERENGATIYGRWLSHLPAAAEQLTAMLTEASAPASGEGSGG